MDTWKTNTRLGESRAEVHNRSLQDERQRDGQRAWNTKICLREGQALFTSSSLWPCHRSTSAENPISLEGIAPFSSRTSSLEGALPGLPSFPAFSGRPAAPSPAHALCSASLFPAPPCGCPRSLVQRRHAGPCPQPWVFPVFPLVWQRVGTAAHPPPGHSLAGAGQFQFWGKLWHRVPEVQRDSALVEPRHLSLLPALFLYLSPLPHHNALLSSRKLLSMNRYFRGCFWGTQTDASLELVFVLPKPLSTSVSSSSGHFSVLVLPDKWQKWPLMTAFSFMKQSDTLYSWCAS